ncbi:MAG TPA: gamma-glutamylcyclotransferase [Candidatus Saccharimonadales bacterium]|nr:gamma-glutamylcyclotransferase [Candidatus Saccharimonadales bacterium]
MAMEIIFGFGSLINTDSLRSTVLEVSDIKPAYVNGFMRRFNLWNDLGFRTYNPGYMGIPHCVLDVEKISDSKSRVNGIAFKVSESQLDKLKNREEGYKLVKTTVYEFKTNKKLGDCHLFSACKNNGKYEFESRVQRKYLEICMEGAKKFGDEFYQEFLDTTYIDDTPLSKISKIISNV